MPITLVVDLSPDTRDFLMRLFGPSPPTTTRIEAMFAQILANQTMEQTAMAALDDDLTALQAQIATDATVEASAVTLIQGIAGQVAAATAAALAAGATPAQLATLTGLTTSLAANDTALAAAVAANTPAAPTPAVALPAITPTATPAAAA
jgi:hypothetical protein